MRCISDITYGLIRGRIYNCNHGRIVEGELYFTLKDSALRD